VVWPGGQAFFSLGTGLHQGPDRDPDHRQTPGESLCRAHRWIQEGTFELHLMTLLQERPEEEEMNRLLSGLS
jgi:hypothetical protein